MLSEDPLAGEEVPGTNGIRKLSFAPTGEGGRGSEREIYYKRYVDMQMSLLLASAQSANSDLTLAESLAVSELAAALRSTDWEQSAAVRRALLLP